jgi:periplasmic protein TonB
METRKSKRADLESKRFLFLQVGIIFALAASLAAFEWKSGSDYDGSLLAISADNTIEEIIQVTVQKDLVPPPPVPQAFTMLHIVDDDIVIDDEIIIDIEDDQNKEVKYYQPVLDDEDTDSLADPEIFIVAEVMPEFPGGYASLQRYLRNNLRYPDVARETGIEGTVYIEFVVAADGSVRNAKILRGIGGGCDEEALRAVMAMPTWIAGKQRGKAVNVAFNLPVSFKLRQ